MERYTVRRLDLLSGQEPDEVGALFGILPMGGLIAGMILLCGAAVFLSFDAARLFASLYAKKKEKD